MRWPWGRGSHPSSPELLLRWAGRHHAPQCHCSSPNLSQTLNVLQVQGPKLHKALKMWVHSSFREARGCSQFYSFPNHPGFAFYCCQMWKYLGENGYHSSKLSHPSGRGKLRAHYLKGEAQSGFPLMHPLVRTYNDFHPSFALSTLGFIRVFFAIPQSTFSFSIRNNCPPSNQTIPCFFNYYVT